MPNAATGAAQQDGSKLIVKKSRTGICHAPTSRYYAQTLNFTAFDTLRAYLASGGQVPR